MAALAVRVGLLESALAVTGPLAAAALPRADLADLLSTSLGNYVTSAALNALLTNMFHVVGYGTGWPTSRPAAAGTRPIFAYGGPAAPTWLSTANKDLWVGTV